MNIILAITTTIFLLSTVVLSWYTWSKKKLITDKDEQIKKLNQSLKSTYDNFVKSNKLLKEENDQRQEVQQELTKYKSSFDERLSTEIELESEKIRSEVEKDFNDALQEQIDDFGSKVKEIDDMLKDRIEEIQSKNTLYFSCSCDKDRKIPVSIDFSTENRFSCDKCGSVYRVELNAYPVLLSNVSNNKVIANIFKEGEQK